MPFKPTVVLMPGSCHTPHHFVDLSATLQQAGYPVSCTQLASVDSPDPHALAGYAGGAAALGLSKTVGTAAGKRGGILGVIFIAAFLSYRDAKPFLKLTNGSWPSEYTVDEDKGVWTFTEPSKLYEPDVPKLLASEAVAALRPMSLRAVVDISPGLVTDWAKSFYKGRMAYIRCTKDAQVPLAFQDLMLEESGGEWIIRSMDAGHSPFLSAPAELAKIIVSLAEEFAD